MVVVGGGGRWRRVRVSLCECVCYGWSRVLLIGYVCLYSNVVKTSDSFSLIIYLMGNRGQNTSCYETYFFFRNISNVFNLSLITCD